MNYPGSMVGALLLLVWSAAAAHEVAFIGLADAGAPAIETQFARILEEQIAAVPGVHLVDNAEVKRLQSRIELFTYPTVTTSLAAALRRCVPDTCLVIWGMVKSCSIRAVKKGLIHAELDGDLCLELAMYIPSTGAYSYVGTIHAAAVKPKGNSFWLGPIDEEIQVSASDRSELLDSLQCRAAVSAASTVKTIVQQKKSEIAATAPDSTKLAAALSDSLRQNRAADSTVRPGQK
jgi:hypothetical protein